MRKKNIKNLIKFVMSKKVKDIFIKQIRLNLFNLVYFTLIKECKNIIKNTKFIIKKFIVAMRLKKNLLIIK